MRPVPTHAPTAKPTALRPILKLPAPRITYCVWRTDTSRVKRSHDTYDEALAEATRLADANPGKRFIVMQSVRSVRRLPVSNGETP